MHTEHVGAILHGTTTTVSVTALRAIGDDHALADADQMIYSADGDVILALHLVSLLTRQHGEWRFADSRPYAFSPPAAQGCEPEQIFHPQRSTHHYGSKRRQSRHR
jgi:hypothetical protein